MEKCREDGGCSDAHLQHVLKVIELIKSVNEIAYQKCLCGKYEVLRGVEV